MSEFPREERPSINLEELDLVTLYRIRDLISLGATEKAGRIMLDAQQGEPVDESVEDEGIRKYITEYGRRIRAESNLEDAERWRRLADEVDALILSKEAGAELDLT